MSRWVVESAVYGIVLVSGLVIVVGDDDASSWESLVKVVATVVVFWLAHVYAEIVARLGDTPDDVKPHSRQLRDASVEAIDHSWGLLAAAAIPSFVLLLGVFGVISDATAVWGALWIDVATLGVLGYWGFGRWSTRVTTRLAGGLATAVLGAILIALKVLIY